VVPVFDSALQRRDRTRQRLTPLGVKSPEHLPPVQAEEETVLRTPGEIARRCVVLSIVAARGEGLPKDKAIATLQRYKLMEELTPKEKEFLAKDAHTEVERTQFVWRYECAQVLLWAMKRVDRLDIPAKPCDAAESTAKVMALADKNEFDSVQLRSKAEILDQLDLVFRCHWAVRDAQIKKTPAPKGLDADCVMEWHQTLNWLIHHENAEWDDVDTGT
jgi:hypothetical protein